MVKARNLETPIKNKVGHTYTRAKVPIRYPGGKQRFLDQIVVHMPKPEEIEGRFVEPFLGGGAVFFAIQAKPAILNDKNPDLIDLYRGIRHAPLMVWKMFCSIPPTRVPTIK